MMRAETRNDIAGGLVLLAIAGLYYAGIGQIAESSLSDDVGAGGLPRILAALLLVFGLILVGRAMMTAWQTRQLVAMPEIVPASGGSDPVATLVRAAGFLGFGAAYLVALPILGYVPSVALLITSVALFEGAMPGWKVPVTAIAGAIGYWLTFVKMLGVKQPAGWFF
jgi:putative tricarboxylic transport membrane protein